MEAGYKFEIDPRIAFQGINQEKAESFIRVMQNEDVDTMIDSFNSYVTNLSSGNTSILEEALNYICCVFDLMMRDNNDFPIPERFVQYFKSYNLYPVLLNIFDNSDVFDIQILILNCLSSNVYLFPENCSLDLLENAIKSIISIDPQNFFSDEKQIKLFIELLSLVDQFCSYNNWAFIDGDKLIEKLLLLMHDTDRVNIGISFLLSSYFFFIDGSNSQYLIDFWAKYKEFDCKEPNVFFNTSCSLKYIAKKNEDILSDIGIQFILLDLFAFDVTHINIYKIFSKMAKSDYINFLSSDEYIVCKICDELSLISEDKEVLKIQINAIKALCKYMELTPCEFMNYFFSPNLNSHNIAPFIINLFLYGNWDLKNVAGLLINMVIQYSPELFQNNLIITVEQYEADIESNYNIWNVLSACLSINELIMTTLTTLTKIFETLFKPNDIIELFIQLVHSTEIVEKLISIRESSNHQDLIEFIDIFFNGYLNAGISE